MSTGSYSIMTQLRNTQKPTWLLRGDWRCKYGKCKYKPAEVENVDMIWKWTERSWCTLKILQPIHEKTKTFGAEVIHWLKWDSTHNIRRPKKSSVCSYC